MDKLNFTRFIIKKSNRLMCKEVIKWLRKLSRKYSMYVWIIIIKLNCTIR